MKNIIVFVDYLDALAFDAAREQLEAGNEVYILYCSGSTKICKANYGKSPLICKLCVHESKIKIKDFIKEPHCHITSMDDIVTNEITALANEQVFDYNDTKGVKAITYKGIDIGYAAFSTFVSVTRNVMPTYNDFVKTYLNDLMRSSIRMIEAQLKYVEDIQPELIIFHNGRHSNLKPIYQIAVQKGIPYICTERQWTKDGEDTYDYYVNTTTHSMKARYIKMQERWEKGREDKVKLAEQFFENRRFGKFSGDQVYIAKQVQGQLPEGFDETKLNIAIFNSSEDEYFSISKELDKSGVWPNQYEALKDIFEHYKDNKDIHFYLRIHPNLGEVPYKSHTMLYDLKYDNVTIFPPYSPISSYALMEHCDKVLVFNSSMGLESAYWGKPVITLNLIYYTYMNITHNPRTPSEVYEMIDDPELPCLKSEQCLKAAYFWMGYDQPKLKYYPIKKKRRTVGPFILETFSQFKLCGSSLLLAIVQKMMRIGTHVGIIGKYNHLGKRSV